MKWNKEQLGAYAPNDIEMSWYDFWEKNGYFHQDPDPSKEPFSIVMPPPNVTGQLHMGHALDNTLQDILVRDESRLRHIRQYGTPRIGHQPQPLHAAAALLI